MLAPQPGHVVADRARRSRSRSARRRSGLRLPISRCSADCPSTTTRRSSRCSSRTRTARIRARASRRRTCSTTARAPRRSSSSSAMRDGRAALITNGQSQTLDVDLRDRERVRGDGPARRSRAASSSRATTRRARRRSRCCRTTTGATRWAAAPDAIGRTLQIGREMVTIVGVLTPDMEFGNIGRGRSLAAAQLESRRPARCPQPALHCAAARRRDVRSGGGRDGGDRRRARERISADQWRLERRGWCRSAISPAARASGS